MNRQAILQYVTKKFDKKTTPEFRVGDTVRVHVRIKEGNTSRVQVFEGIVISFKGTELDRTFTVRKISFGVGVERIFPLHSQTIEKIQIVRSGHIRRAKLYFLRSRVGKAARLEEIDRGAPGKAPKNAASAGETETTPQEELVAAEEK